MGRRVTTLLGALLVVAALAYFVLHAQRALSAIDLGQFARPDVAIALLVLTTLYTACVIPNAFGWKKLLDGLGAPVRYRRSLASLSFTQIGKYLPGNVGHHIGRIGLLRTQGIPVSTGLYSLGYEAILAALASIHIGALVLLWQPPPAIAEHPAFTHKFALMGLFTAGAAATIMMAPLGMRVLQRIRRVEPSSVQGFRLGIGPAACSYLTSSCGLLFVGLGLWMMSYSLMQAPPPNPLFFVGAFAASWIVGFLAPGAPAGLGVREAVLSLWLGTIMPPAQAVLLVIALRVATTAGDLLNFVAGAIATAKFRGTPTLEHESPAERPGAGSLPG